MQSTINRLVNLSDAELLQLSEAIDSELNVRESRLDEPDSARRRAIRRDKSYRRATGSTAPPVRVVGLKKKDRFAA